ncbi:uncharacterized protein K452DRAFT_17057 [Aplosporella prunicola CBS 121167]|uniref:tripeptidyl-peptidase II n=1 Tax=Aplosporella prunicola CBS 121167 TaxID=1176127 RepID=A0A6A6BE11_9PEZI|nr:uncharacterized protein K452DRAFT_17057 [Aplosporella prunicola CBS 121167]KAF2142316.1 hypothetical protein K452DRAFT_17057 [Aplosporella prunicola CBS 121167]
MVRKSLVFAAVAAWQSQTALAGVLDLISNLPTGWLEASLPEVTHRMTLQIGLKQQNQDKLISRLYEVSTPGHPNYGKHLDRDEVNTMVQPTEESDKAVRDWLESEGVTDIHSDGHWVTFSTHVGVMNKLLDTTFKFYDFGGTRKLRTTKYSVPDEVHDHIDLIWPTTFFGQTRGHGSINGHGTAKGLDKIPNLEQMAGNATLDVVCATATPECLKMLYNIGNYTADASSGSRIGFGNFLNESASYRDLELFQDAFKIPGQNFSVELINGGVNDQEPGENHGEANMDVQTINGVSHPLPITAYITGGNPPFIPNLDEPEDNGNEPYMPFYQHLLNKTNAELPQVITNSYGDDEQTVPAPYARRVCNMIAQLGLRGITVLESSGDTGIGGPCQSNDGKKTLEFTPTFPGTCPYITAVGGTTGVSPEKAWSGSTGGFSAYFPRPAYQDEAVTTYLDKHVSAETRAYYKPYFNASGRAFPDVAATSLTPDYVIVNNEKIELTGGTSAAAPVFAGIVALLNDARLRANKAPLGFLNPWLYAEGYKFMTDVTAGASEGCNGVNGQTGEEYEDSGIIPGAAWNATEGWDPVTGFGTPDFAKLLEAVGGLS